MSAAALELTVDRSAAPSARRNLRRDLAEAITEDIAGIHSVEPLRFYGKDGEIDPKHRVTPDDLKGYIGLILWTTGYGWLDGIEMHQVGNFGEAFNISAGRDVRGAVPLRWTCGMGIVIVAVATLMV